MSYKKFIPCIYLYKGNAVKGFTDNTIIDTKISDTSITFNLELDDNDEFIQLTIEASSVDISKDK